MKEFDDMTLYEQLLYIGSIFIILIFLAGFTLGRMVGEYQQMKFTEKNVEDTANGNYSYNVIIFDGKYYQVNHFNITDYINITNNSIIKR